MSCIVAFKANDEEESDIKAYCRDHHFKSIPDFARVAVFAYVRRNKPGAHHSKKGMPEAIEAGRDSAPLSVEALGHG